ncbi:MAG: hypothetical protein AAF479_00760 [Pseudomonadota bacterium]
MLKQLAVAVFLLLLPSGWVWADPVGRYQVDGIAAGTGERYRGTVEVTKSGDRYGVAWDLDGIARRGVALGGAFSGGSFVIGPAHEDDLMLAIGFQDDNGFGTLTMFLQPDGHYEGFLLHSTGVVAGQEIWTLAAE